MPCVGGVQPVENDVQATGVTIGTLDRSVPEAERRHRAARFGIRPRSNRGPKACPVPPSRPRNITRVAGAGMRGRLGSDAGARPPVAPTSLAARPAVLGRGKLPRT